jgi:dihydropyrimidinase
MLDIIIRGGDVVTPQGVVQGDVAIAGETIAAVTSPGALVAQTATREIDAAGRIIMPGGIDPHVHLHHVWIKPDGTPLVTAGPEQVGRAALFGGTTTLIDFAYWRDGASARDAIEARARARATGPTTSCCTRSRPLNLLGSSPRQSRPDIRRSRFSPPTSCRRAPAG